jgi:hypothetical protein
MYLNFMEEIYVLLLEKKVPVETSWKGCKEVMELKYAIEKQIVRL